MPGEVPERRQRISAYALIIENDSVLLARIATGYPYEGRWTLPGGGLNWGEDPRDAVRRELYEETGLRGSVEDLLGIDNLHVERVRDGKNVAFHGVRIVYRMTATGTPRVTEVDGSVAESRWIRLDELSAIPAVPLVAAALRMVD